MIVVTEETESVLVHKSPRMEQSKARMRLDWLYHLKPKLPEYTFTKYEIIYLPMSLNKASSVFLL